MTNKKKPIKCVEENLIFESRWAAGKWIEKKLHEEEYYCNSAVIQILAAIKRNGTAFGYHWENVLEECEG